MAHSISMSLLTANSNSSDTGVNEVPKLNVMEIFVNSKFKRPAMANMMLYEGCGEEGPIRSIFFAEFHPTLGPRMRYQAPSNSSIENDHVDKEFFDAISHYLIPKPELQRRHLTLNVNGKKICGYSIIIDDSKYPRNQFMFNMCFVCYPWSRTVQFEPAIRKFSEYLVMLEKENEFLSKEENTEQLKLLMEKVYYQLNDKNKAIVQVGRYMLNLKVVPNKPDPPSIHDWNVPVLLIDRNFEKDDWDLTTKEILPFIDGKNYVKRIACLSQVKTDLVKACVQNLVYYRVVQCLDGIFMYSNEYMVTPEIRLFRENKDFRKEFFRFLYYLDDDDQPLKVTLDSKTKIPTKRVPFTDIFKLITSFKKGTTCKDIMREFFPEKKMGFDLFRLVSYLNLKGILKRVHSYPVYPPNDESRFGSSSTNTQQLIGTAHEVAASTISVNGALINRNDVYQWFDGQHHFDEICLRAGITSQRELQKICDDDPDVVIIRR